MSPLVITIDTDWACEAAIDETLNFFFKQNIPITVFLTHRSKIIENNMHLLDVGLHPFFGEHSSHGNSVAEVVKHVMDLPHNLKAFRSHRFGSCNQINQAMLEAGMLVSSNVCTFLESISPFENRFGLLEVPVYFEDGGYLWRQSPLIIDQTIKNSLATDIPKVILIHPMHFVINTPNFDYMSHIKNSCDRFDWNNMNKSILDKFRWSKRGIRDFIMELLEHCSETRSLRHVCRDELIKRGHSKTLL